MVNQITYRQVEDYRIRTSLYLRRKRNNPRQMGLKVQGLSSQTQTSTILFTRDESILYQHCVKVERQAQEMFDRLIEEM